MRDPTLTVECPDCDAPAGETCKPDCANDGAFKRVSEIEDLRRQLAEAKAENERLLRCSVPPIGQIDYGKLYASLKAEISSLKDGIGCTEAMYDELRARYEALREAASEIIDSCPRCQGQESTEWPPTQDNILECTQHAGLVSALADAPEAQGEGSGSAS